MKKSHLLGAVCACLITVGSSYAEAAVVDAPNVTIGGNSYRTFIDDTTGYTWLDLDNFWDNGSNYNTITSLLTGSDFHLATLSELQVLQASIPAIPANFTSEAIIVGGNYVGKPTSPLNRDIILGIFEDGNSNDGIPYSSKAGSDTTWSTSNNAQGGTAPLTNDLGAWVVNTTVVPILPAVWLFGSGLLGLVGIARRKKTV